MVRGYWKGFGMSNLMKVGVTAIGSGPEPKSGPKYVVEV